MPIVTATAIRDFLEGYGVTTAVLTDVWIESCRDNQIVPIIERVTAMKFDEEVEVEEYYSGTGKSYLMLNRRPVNSIEKILRVGTVTGANLAPSVELIAQEGMLKVASNYSEGIYGPIFDKGDKNLKITYKYGTADYPADVNEAIKLFVSAKALNFIGARTGGGSLTVQSHGRNYGTHGKYEDIRKEFVSTAWSILSPRMRAVVGS